MCRQETPPPEYLACIEMSVDLDDDLVILIGRLLSGHHHLRRRQVLQLVHLERAAAGYRQVAELRPLTPEPG